MNLKKKSLVLKLFALIAIITASVVSPAAPLSSRAQAAASAVTEPPYTMYTDIPGVTADEINEVNALKAKTDYFVYGMNYTTEAFYKDDGEIGGYSALFCAWLEKLFGIPFKVEIYQWNDLLNGLASGDIDFTGELTATDERRQVYSMTDAIALHPIKAMRIEGSEPLSEIESMRTPKFAFLDGATTAGDVANYAGFDFESYYVANYAEAYELLKSGEVDAFLDESFGEAGFDEFGDVVADDFFPLIYNPVSLSTRIDENKVIIDIVQKAIAAGASSYLTELYGLGQDDYLKHKLSLKLTSEEIDYIKNNPVIPYAAEYDNYPINFYNTHDKAWEGIAQDVLLRVEDLTGLTFTPVNGARTERPDLLNSLESGKALMITELIRSDLNADDFIWPQTNFFTDNFALISTTDYPEINATDILYVKVGLVKDTASAEIFEKWFPGHGNVITYDNVNQAMSALGRGDIDMVMSSQSQLLMLTNYNELPGYKANFVFDASYESTFGFNKDASILCSIVDKTLGLIDTKTISDGWMRKNFDYREKIASSRLPWLIGAISLLFVTLILAVALLRRKSREGALLERLVSKRTQELDRRRNLTLAVNEAATLLLEAEDDDYDAAMKNSMATIGKYVEADRIILWRNSRGADGELYFSCIFYWIANNIDFLSAQTVTAYKNALPRIEPKLAAGEVINGPVDELPETERDWLSRFNVVSVMVTPIFYKNDFWGFASFVDCNKKRVFSENDVYILRSWSLLAVGAIKRNEISINMRRMLKKLEAVMYNYKGVIWSVDPNGVITTFNGQYLKVMKIQPSDLEGINIEDARGKDKNIDIIAKAEETFHEGSYDWIGEIDGVVFHSHTAPMYDEDGNILGIVGSTDDITEMMNLQKDLETALAAAEDANRAKSVFLANMSHEIRTPMNAIIGMTAIGKNSADMERKDYCFSKVEDASKHLLGVINEILDMSKIEANKFELSPSEFNFEKMLQTVVNVVNFRVDERKQKFIVSIDGAIPNSLIGDDQRLAQVITNLLGNAIKFTPEGGSISLDAKLMGEAEGFYEIRFIVADTGIGISEKQQEKLFVSFQQAESSTSRKYGGTGLGLAISKSIVEMMDGKIRVESELGAGSKFIFTVKLKRGAYKKPELIVQDVNMSGLRVLIVDDDRDVLVYFQDIMKGAGLYCDAAESGEQALEMLTGGAVYDFYFIDWRLPGIDGVELVRTIKEKHGREKAVVVMISAAEFNVIEKEAKGAGVDKFLAKPLFPSTVLNIITEYAEAAAVKKEEEPSFDGIFAGKRILLAEDVEINREIVLALLEPTKLAIDCALNGAEAVRMFSEAPDNYDMIFMDLQMPEMDGYEATKRIRSLAREWGLEKAAKIPIVAMTANVFKDDVEKSLESGMNSHIGKPINIEQVIEKLKEFLPK